MRAFSNSERPSFRRDTSQPTDASHLPVEALRLCALCDAVPEDILSLELGYEHYLSIKLLRNSAGSNEYCHLCQMMWESIATKQRFDVSGDPMLLENWPIMMYAVQVTGKEAWSWRGYTAVEFRSGDRSSSQDCTWSTAPTWSSPGLAGTVYPIVSRLYLHPGDHSNPLTYTNADLDTRSVSSMKQIRHWSDNCKMYHNHSIENTVHNLPTRVIDIRPALSRLKLHVQRDSNSSGASQYAALSYCWGKSKAATTTTKNLQQHIADGFELESLPRTIQDAITVARALGLRYLWVDALCILQGSDPEARHDWDIESSKMASVYGDAYVTIIAASSSDCKEGIFTKRNILSTSKISTDGFLGRKIWSAHRKLDSHLGLSTQYNVRAWTLQEMVLSQRALFFTPSMKYWKCASGVIGEDCKQARFTAVKSMTKELVQENWHAVVQEYSRRKLTNGEDKLPALSGLARLYHEKYPSPYLTGLWRSTLHKDLLWRTELCEALMPPVQEYRAPSWSWASTNECVDFDLAPTTIDDVSYSADFTANIVPGSLDPFGRIRQATLIVRGKVALVQRLVINAFHSAGDAVTPSGLTVRAYVDHKQRWEDAEPITYECYLLLVTHTCGLLVAPSKRTSDEFRRVGMFVVPNRRKVVQEESWQVVTWRLV